MTRIVVLGASGLIGHKLVQKLGERFGDVYGVIRRRHADFAAYGVLPRERTIEAIDVADFDVLRGVLSALGPTVILNCAGITKRRRELGEPQRAIAVNSLVPHRLAEWAQANGARLIHFSSDCVFDGTEGGYTEASPTTAKEPYGRTKALGEVDYGPGLTLRSSFIGLELSAFSELLEWFLAQHGRTVKGFTNAWYSGISTPVMARIVGDIIAYHPQLEGLYQIGLEEPISKHDLLCLARDAFGVDVGIEPEPNVVTRPTLDGTALRQAIGLHLPDWGTMMDGLARERSIYGR